MTRQEFLKYSAIFGMATPFLSTLLTSCSSKIPFYEGIEVNFSGKVLIIGAGAAGLTAGHILNKYDIDFEIIEASPVFGGRVKKNDTLADFPIDMGGEWIHTDPNILAKLVNEPSSDISIDIIKYSPQTLYFWKNNELRKGNFYANFYSEHKFKDTTWYDFFDQYIVPKISSKIVYNSPVTAIDYTSDKVQVTIANGTVYEADKVLITVPTTILQNNSIAFSPALPAAKVAALNDAFMPDGIKVFIEFSERFHPDIIYDGGLAAVLGSENNEKIFYDAAFRKDSNSNILGLFTIGENATAYTSLDSEEAIIAKVLGELDQMYDGKASKVYLNHAIQNWSAEPYIQGAYTYHNGSEAANVKVMQEPLGNKVYFAGEALAESSATVHGAAESSYVTLETMLKNG